MYFDYAALLIKKISEKNYETIKLSKIYLKKGENKCN